MSENNETVGEISAEEVWREKADAHEKAMAEVSRISDEMVKLDPNSDEAVALGVLYKQAMEKERVANEEQKIARERFDDYSRNSQ